jgi:hypothetical protein
MAASQCTCLTVGPHLPLQLNVTKAAHTSVEYAAASAITTEFTCARRVASLSAEAMTSGGCGRGGKPAEQQRHLQRPRRTGKLRIALAASWWGPWGGESAQAKPRSWARATHTTGGKPPAMTASSGRELPSPPPPGPAPPPHTHTRIASNRTWHTGRGGPEWEWAWCHEQRETGWLRLPLFAHRLSPAAFCRLAWSANGESSPYLSSSEIKLPSWRAHTGTQL